MRVKVILAVIVAAAMVLAVMPVVATLQENRNELGGILQSPIIIVHPAATVIARESIPFVGQCNCTKMVVNNTTSSNLKIDVSTSWDYRDSQVWLLDTTTVTAIHRNTTYWWKSQEWDSTDNFSQSTSASSGATEYAIVGKVATDPSGTGFRRPFPETVKLAVTVVDLQTGETLQVTKLLKVPEGFK